MTEFQFGMMESFKNPVVVIIVQLGEQNEYNLILTHNMVTIWKE